MSDPVNILYLIDSLHYGGTELQLVQLIRNLDRSRFQPHICTLKPSNSLYDELDIPKLFLDFKGFNCVSLPRNILHLNRFIRTHQIQLIQTFFQDPFLLAALVKPFHRVKLIGSFRDLGFWRTSVETRKMRISYPFYSGFIANSNAVKEYFVSTDRLQPKSIAVIYNGFDYSALEKLHEENTQSNNGKYIGIVANLNRPIKRVDDFIRAAAIIHEKFPEVRFVIVGDGHLKNELKELAHSLGVEDAINFTGRVANPIDHIRLFTVGVITSETEGFCNAVIEYMACGIPVVVTRAGGNNEIVHDGQNGYLAEVGDYRGIAEKVISLLECAQDALVMGITGAETIREIFTIEKLVKNHYRFYERLLLHEIK